MSKGVPVLLAVTGVGLVSAISYTVGWWPSDIAAPIHRDGMEFASSWPDRMERVATAGILIGGVIAIGVASWRAHSANQQAHAARQQVDTALRQTEVSQRRLLDERFQQAAQMLGSSTVSTRLGGIHALDRLVEDDSERYRPDVIRLLTTFIRYPTHHLGAGSSAWLRDDIQAAVDSIGRRNEPDSRIPAKALQNKAVFRHEYGLVELDDVVLRRARFSFSNFQTVLLIDADLSGIYSFKANFSNANLARATIVGATLMDTDFSEADLHDASLTSSRVKGSVFSDANLTGTDVSGVDFSGDGEHPACGLTQAQLDTARANPNNPPNLQGVVDCKTRQPLVWRGLALTQPTIPADAAKVQTRSS
ncbi:MAG: pentapeptide repeat-containing protein [Chloroflexi bacterium]|nr:pentapeptide repeat-containing protein [Chloroflexota bacterium]MYJ91796.1 pentapeptide repeat-containing protein [Chloroflexota bacterium]